MRALVSIAALGLLALPVAAHAQAPAQPLPEWAYPVAPAPKPPGCDEADFAAGQHQAIHPGPDRQPLRPAGLVSGRSCADARSGRHRPAAERLRLRALPSDQRRRPSGIRRHLRSAGAATSCARWRSSSPRARKGMRGGIMIQIAKGISDEDTKAAAEYFSSIKYPVWYKVVEGRHRAEVLSRQRRHALSGGRWRHRADRQPHHRAAAE